MPAVKTKKRAKRKSSKASRKTPPSFAAMSRPKRPKQSKDYYSVRDLLAKEKTTSKTVYGWLRDGKIAGARRATDRDHEKGFDPGEWMIPKKGYKRPHSVRRAGLIEEG